MYAPGKERRTSQWQHKAVLETVQDRLDRNSDKMRVRRQTVEHPFGTIKAWMGATHFQMRTLPKMATEMALHVLAYNMKRVMRILVDFLAKDATIRSNTSVCLEVVDPAITELAPDAQASFAKSLASLLEKEKVAFDVGAYRDAPPGLRIWCGATVETKDVEALTPWLDFERNSEGRSRQSMTFSRGPPSGSPSRRQPR